MEALANSNGVMAFKTIAASDMLWKQRSQDPPVAPQPKKLNARAGASNTISWLSRGDEVLRSRQHGSIFGAELACSVPVSG
jgi:hypothetical protein